MSAKNQLHTLDPLLTKALEHLIGTYKPSSMAKAIMAISDSYIHNEAPDNLWNDPQLTQAYLAYFMPLNTLRYQSALARLTEVGFLDSLTQLIEFGSGAGAFYMALAGVSNTDFNQATFIEAGSEAKEVHKKLREQLLSQSKVEPLWSEQKNIKPTNLSLGVFSYSYNEIERLPDWAIECEGLLIIEPSTHHHNRRLLELRESLIKQGFYAWAPCTHQQTCPLLDHKKDWCHDRVNIELPEFMRKLENHLPMKNETITYSYLALRKTPPKNLSTNQARLIGDQLKEKGKTRQLICRSSEREFLSWLKRYGEAPSSFRGDLYQLPEKVNKVSNEIRIS